jgi:hypothetical protein
MHSDIILQLRAVEYISKYTMLVVRAPNRRFVSLDAVLIFGITAGGEGRPCIAIGNVLFREPSSALFQLSYRLNKQCWNYETIYGG